MRASDCGVCIAQQHHILHTSELPMELKVVITHGRSPFHIGLLPRQGGLRAASWTSPLVVRVWVSGQAQRSRSGLRMASRRTIVVAVDDSEASAYAFTWAFHSLFRKTDHVLVLSAAPVVSSNLLASPSFHAAGSAYGAVPLAHPMATEAAQRCITENLKSLVHKYMDQCARAGIPCQGEVVKGEPGSWIVDEADRVGADAVVLGSHGYGVTKRTFLGSVSDYVLHRAHSTVIIVRLSEHLQEHDPLKSSGLPK